MLRCPRRRPRGRSQVARLDGGILVFGNAKRLGERAAQYTLDARVEADPALVRWGRARGAGPAGWLGGAQRHRRASPISPCPTPSCNTHLQETWRTGLEELQRLQRRLEDAYNRRNWPTAGEVLDALDALRERVSLRESSVCGQAGSRLVL